MHSPLFTHHSPLTLRLFRPQELSGESSPPHPLTPSPPQLSPEMTLCDLFREYFLPVRLLPGGTAPSTIAQYEESLGLWSLYTGDPPLREIDEFVTAEFVRRLSGRIVRGERPDLSPDRTISANTVRKHCRHVRPVLNVAGPRGPHNRLGRGLVEPPWLTQPPERFKPATDGLSLDEISRWLEICYLARRPRLKGIDPPEFWRALILFLYNTGLRIETALSVTWSMIEDNWLVVPAELMKGRRRGGRFWINPYARRAAESIRRQVVRRAERLFPWPTSMGNFHALRRALVEKSKLPGCRRWRPHALRKSLLTYLMGVNPAIAKLQAGHAGNDVTLKHYTDPAIVQSVLAEVPQPQWTERDPQLRLF